VGESSACAVSACLSPKRRLRAELRRGGTVKARGTPATALAEDGSVDAVRAAGRRGDERRESGGGGEWRCVGEGEVEVEEPAGRESESTGMRTWCGRGGQAIPARLGLSSIQQQTTHHRSPPSHDHSNHSRPLTTSHLPTDTLAVVFPTPRIFHATVFLQPPPSHRHTTTYILCICTER
jgi:hypothetical protein